MKIGVIKQLAGQHSVRKLCRTLGVARNAYSVAAKKPARPRARDNARLGEKMGELFEASGRTYGSPRLTVALRRAGERCSRRRVARLMRRAGLRARQKRRWRPRTTDGRHLCPIAPQSSGGTSRATGPTQRSMAGRHRVCRYQRRLALRGRRARCVQPQNRRLGGGRSDAHRAGRPRLPSGPSRRGDPHPGGSTTPTAAASTPARRTASTSPPGTSPRA